MLSDYRGVSSTGSLYAERQCSYARHRGGYERHRASAFR